MSKNRAHSPFVCQRYDLRSSRNVLTWIRRTFWAAR